VGQYVRLWPYTPGVFGVRDLLYRVWKLMEEDGATALAFWDETGFSTSGDLNSFVRAFDGAPGKVLILVERIDIDPPQLCGAIWLTNLVYGHQGFVSMWMTKDTRGAIAKDAATLVLPSLFTLFNLQQLWAVTPWANAGAMCRRVGFKRWCLLPSYCQWEGHPKDVQLYRLTREQIRGT
jgi:RimJ/RimL family protein N-acetyltransferase